jgi:hypothetical protein
MLNYSFQEISTTKMGSPITASNKIITNNTPPMKTRLWADIEIDMAELKDNAIFSSISGNTKLKGRIPLTLGAEDYPFPKIPDSLMTEDNWLKDWLLSSGLIRKGDTGEEILSKAKDYCLGSIYFVPQAEPGSEEMKVYMKFFALSCLLDDIIEETNILGRNKQTSFKMPELGADVIMGKYEKIEDLPDSYPTILPVMKASFLASQKAREVIPTFKTHMGHFVRKMSQTLSSMGLFQLEDREKEGNISESTFRYLRRYEAGIEPFIELAALVLGLDLTQETRDHLLVRRALDLASSIAAHVNDLLGIKRDLRKGEGYNLVLFKANYLNITLEAAFGQVVEVVTRDTEDFILTCKRLRSLFDKNMKLNKFLRIAEQLVDGHLYWYTKIKRYGELAISVVREEVPVGVGKKVKYLQTEKVRNALANMQLWN